MAKYIKTMVDENGDTIFPRTRGNAIVMSDGSTGLETKIAEKVDKTQTVNTKALSGNITLNAIDIPNTPAGNIVATTVQAAINELDTDKLSVVSHDATMTGDGTPSNVLVVANDGHTHDTRYYTEAEVDTKDATKADKLMATNLVTNGDFSNGTTGWVGESSVLTSGINTLISTGNGGSAYDTVRHSGYIPIVLNHKFYLRALARVTDALSTAITLTTTLYNPSFVSNNQVAIKLSPSANIYNILSGIITIPSSGITTMRPYVTAGYVDSATQNGKVLETQYVLVSDLTAIFGAGKEPTALEMDNLLSYFPNSWFNGTTELAPLINILRTKADKTQEAWLNATLTAGWTGIIQYAKNSLGFVTIKFRVVTSTVAFATVFSTVPVGYRPSEVVPIILRDEGSGFVVAEVIINANGNLQYLTGSATGRTLAGEFTYYVG